MIWIIFSEGEILWMCDWFKINSYDDWWLIMWEYIIVVYWGGNLEGGA